MNQKQYNDYYLQQFNTRSQIIVRALSGLWTATSTGQGETKARENVSIQIQAMRDYLDELEADLLKAEVQS